MPPDNHLLRVYFGHHKSASQYIKAVFLQAAGWLGLTPTRVDNFSARLPLDYQQREPFPELLREHRERLRSERLSVLCLTNGDTEAVSLLSERREPFRGFHVIRDPRDILVSAYFSHLHSHPIRSQGGWIAEIRSQLQAASSLENGLLMEIEFNAPIFDSMGAWNYNDERIYETRYETRYETLILNPMSEFVRIFNFLGIATPGFEAASLAAILRDRVWHKVSGRSMPHRERLPLPVLTYNLRKNAFERNTRGRRPGQEDAHHHYRKGIPGDWRNYFSPRVVDAFKKRYGPLLIQLGYETSDNWMP